MEYRIALLSLSGKTPQLVTGAANDSSLHIMEVQSLPNNIQMLREKLDMLLPRYQKNNVTLFIDDPARLFSEYGYQVSLSDVINGELVLAKSLERYFILSAAGGITSPADIHGMDIPRNIINTRTNDKGEVSYQVNWDRIPDNARSLLLMIHCGFGQQLHNESYSSAFFAALNETDKQQESSAATFARAIATANHFEVDRSIQEELERTQNRRFL